MSRQYIIGGPLGVSFFVDDEDRDFALRESYVTPSPNPWEDVPYGWDSGLSTDGLVLENVFTSSSSGSNAVSVTAHDSGKWYAEVTATTSAPISVGVFTSDLVTGNYWDDSSNLIWAIPSGTFLAGIDPAFAENDVISIAADFDLLKVWFRKNGGTWTPGTPPSGTPSVIEASDSFHIVVGCLEDAVVTLETETFAYSPPSGFEPWYEVGGGASDTAEPTGQELAVSVGTVSVPSGISVNVTGQAVTTSVGTVTVEAPIGTPVSIENTGTTTTTVTSASFSVTTGAVIFAHAISHGVTASIPTISDSIGGTWVPMSAGFDLESLASRLFYKVSTGASQTVTVVGGGAHTALTLVSVGGINVDFSNFQGITDLVGDPSVTLATMASTSGAIYFGTGHPGSAFSVGSGYTEMFDATPTTNTRSVVGYDLTSPGTTVLITSTNTDSILYAFELEASGANISVNVPVDGQALTMAVGGVEVTAGGNITADVTGQAVTMAVGDATVEVDVSTDAVAGQQLTVAVGDATVSSAGNVSTTLTGQQLTAYVGDVTTRVPINVYPSGNQMAVSVGQITYGGGIFGDATTNLLTTSVGTIANVIGKANVSLASNGQQMAVSVDAGTTVVGKATATLTTTTAMTASVGTIASVKEGISITLAGQEMTAACGTIANVENDMMVYLTTTDAITVSMGSVSISGSGVAVEPPPDREGMMLIMSRWMGN